jgi:hypothetical protein
MKQSVFTFFFLISSFLLFAQDSASLNAKKTAGEIHEIEVLTKVAESDKYGLAGEFPVKVGKGASGGPFNQRAYLDLLRDGQGNPVQYKRIGGGCCPYKSANGLGGYALVDRYEVIYKDKEGKSKKAVIYISFYDYEEPLIPIGFQTVTSH